MTSTDLIVIDSKSRVSGTSNSFRINLSENLSSGTYEFESFNMTNSLYNVVTGENDTIYFENSIDGIFSAILLPGFYSTTSLRIEIEDQMSAASTSDYTVDYNSTTGFYTFTPSLGNLKFLFGSNSLSTARYLLGKDSVDENFSAIIVSDFVIDLKLHDNIIIKISQDNNQHGTLPNGTEFSLIVPIEETALAFGNIIHYKRNTSFSQTISFLTGVSALDIELFAFDGDLLNINGVEFCMVIKKLF